MVQALREGARSGHCQVVGFQLPQVKDRELRRYSDVAESLQHQGGSRTMFPTTLSSAAQHEYLEVAISKLTDPEKISRGVAGRGECGV